MTQLQQLQFSKKDNKAQYFKQSLRIDMTPLVDLGFLLITFFIFTTTMAESKTMKLFMPEDSNDHPTKAPESATVSVLLGKNDKAYTYNGKWENAMKSKQIEVTNYDVARGLGSFLRTKQLWLNDHNPEGKTALIYLIKPAETSNFKNVVDALDEATINGITHYSISPLSEDEIEFMKDK